MRHSASALRDKIKVLDRGYVKYIGHMGNDELIVESARMSTGKGFFGWVWEQDTYADCICKNCLTQHLWETLPKVDVEDVSSNLYLCTNCWSSEVYHLAAAEENKLDFYRDIKLKLLGRKGQPRDFSLLETLYMNRHSTPFESGELMVEIYAPILVFREWQRARTQCLAGDTKIYFELPDRFRKGKKTSKKITIEELWRKWQPTIRTDRPERQTNALWPRSRIGGMLLRCLNEETGEFTTTRIVDVIQSGPKPVFRITTASGKSIKASADHQFFTDQGWKKLRDFVILPQPTSSSWSASAMLTVGTTVRNKAKSWEPPPFDLNEERWLPVVGWEDLYRVSNMGRLMRIAPGQGVKTFVFREGTVGAQDYPVISLSRESKTYLRTVHSPVLEAFVGPKPEGCEARHADHNRLNCRLSNLSWGSSKENSGDMLEADRHQRLVAAYEQIVNVECLAWEVTYDLTVEGPWRNFVAEGIVVHNSYNEFSARYAQMPNEHYVPGISRIRKQSTTNKQGSGEAFSAPEAALIQVRLEKEQKDTYQHYDELVRKGVAKEVARINTPVSRYSKMRAKTDLRNWFWFLGLRMENGAQWEIRQYANAVASIIKEIWPKSFDLFIEHDFLSVRFSRSEMAALRRLLSATSDSFVMQHQSVVGLEGKKHQAFLDKLTKNKDDDYREVLIQLGVLEGGPS